MPEGDQYLEKYASVSSIVKQTLPLLVICVILGLFAGVVLGGMKASLEALPGLLVLVPAILDTRGNIFGAFGSRLGSALHQGLILPELERDDNLMHSIAAALGEGVIISIVLAVIAHYVILALGRDSIGIIPLTAISLIAGVVSGIVLTGLIILLAFAGYNKGIDPDNITGPIATTAGDVLAMLALFMAAEIVLGAI
ncbi:MAG: magnesium transporter [Methanocellales archaeon]|nr:magnesium transporter [Methanocellales archaeon]MDD3292367.1 magnesium transporter [Methanocellales archaeon]MDD5236033.1 magnesium transporter [Methanocellales archaeon]MDD5485855.1 magnesium transporter [Methanocellales archaeon]